MLQHTEPPNQTFRPLILLQLLLLQVTEIPPYKCTPLHQQYPPRNVYSYFIELTPLRNAQCAGFKSSAAAYCCRCERKPCTTRAAAATEARSEPFALQSPYASRAHTCSRPKSLCRCVITTTAATAVPVISIPHDVYVVSMLLLLLRILLPLYIYCSTGARLHCVLLPVA